MFINKNKHFELYSFYNSILKKLLSNFLKESKPKSKLYAKKQKKSKIDCTDWNCFILL